MNTKELECFLSICEEGSITKAAKKMFITPQGMSRITRKLEDEVGSVILVRTQNGVELTDEGIILQKHAIKIMEHMNFMNLEMERKHKNVTGKLSIAASYGLIAFYSPKSIISFREQHPDIQVTFKEYTDQKVQSSVWFGESDYGLTYGPVDSEKYDAVDLDENELYLIVNKNNPLSQYKEVTFDMLKGQRFVLQNSEFQLHNYVKDQCINAGFMPEVIFETNGICMCNKMCAADLAISITMKHTIKDIIMDSLVLIPFAGRQHRLKIQAISKHDNIMTEEMRLFMDHMNSWSYRYQ